MSPLPSVVIGAVIAVMLMASSPGPARAGDDLAARVQALLPESPGACVFVYDRGALVFQHAYGLADVDGDVPCTPQTNFRMASVSKQFTALAALMLVDRGKLSLDDTLAKFFPGYPEYGARVTIRHLLTHTSGVPDYEELIPAGTTLQLGALDIVQMLLDAPEPLFPAGQRWQYSNSAYVLLGQIVEIAAQRPYHDWMAAEVFAPLGMTGACIFQRGLNEVSHRAYGHRREAEGRWVRHDQSVTSATRGDGCVYTSLEDYAKWLAGLRDNRLLSDASWRAMFSPQEKTTRDGAHYGFGWFIDQFAGTRRIYHNGDSRGFRLTAQTFPDRQAAVLVQLNADVDANMTEVGERVARLLIFDRSE
ncbi:MAG TPA: serine hydrolase domain-containing protein [Lacipirellulaceae bacterium]|nr:serine hydrolase domain-containing protein [Lacipirellulaceae bacterium]